MEMCSNGHDEIVVLGSDCPLCEAMETILSLEGEVDELRD